MKVDVKIYTDGSGHISGFGGWAAYIVTPDRILKDLRMGSACGTSVDRMEFTALLEGCQGAWEMSRKMPEAQFESWRPSVLWFTDRENLLLSVKKTYGRTNCPDLWKRFEYYESHMDITGQFATEEFIKTSVEFREVDLQSSAGYQQIKAYINSMPLTPHFSAI